MKRVTGGEGDKGTSLSMISFLVFFTTFTFLLFNLVLGVLIPGSLTEPGNLFQKKYTVQSWASFHLVCSHALPAGLWDFLKALLSPLGPICLFVPLTSHSQQPVNLNATFFTSSTWPPEHNVNATFCTCSTWPLGRVLMPPFFFYSFRFDPLAKC